MNKLLIISAGGNSFMFGLSGILEQGLAAPDSGIFISGFTGIIACLVGVVVFVWGCITKKLNWL